MRGQLHVQLAQRPVKVDQSCQHARRPLRGAQGGSGEGVQRVQRGVWGAGCCLGMVGVRPGTRGGLRGQRVRSQVLCTHLGSASRRSSAIRCLCSICTKRRVRWSSTGLHRFCERGGTGWVSDSRLDLNRHGLCAGRAQLQCARFERPLQAEALTSTCLMRRKPSAPSSADRVHIPL